jgi:AsmA family protein
MDLCSRGRDLAKLYYLTQLTLPNSPPYELSVHLVRDGQRVSARAIFGTLGRALTGRRIGCESNPRR